LAFPYEFESNFEGGVETEWTGTPADTDSALDVAHYKTLAAMGMEPYSGAYCLRLQAGLGANDATLTEGACNIADTATAWFRFNIYFSNNFTCTATDASVSLLELQGAANAITASFGFRITVTTDVINLGIGSAAAAAVPATFSSNALERGKWYTVELKVNIETDGSGTMDMYVTEDGGVQATGAEASLATKTNIAVTHAVIGLQDHLATTSGYILIDNFAQDSEQLYHQVRYPETVLLTKTGHAFVGPGKIETLTLLGGGGADAVCNVYDSDAASSANLVATISNDATSQTVTRVTPITVARGAYITLAGTASANGPRALVKLANASHSAGTVRRLGAK
jgi:hypothetical protein